MALTYRLEKGSFLTHEEMDNNFRSLFFSSSISDGGSTLKLHYNTNPTSYHEIFIGSSSGSGSGSSIAITNHTGADSLLTTNIAASSINAEGNLTFNGSILSLLGRLEISDGVPKNIFIGEEAGELIDSNASDNLGIGYQALKNTTGINNIGLGRGGLGALIVGNSNLAGGYNALTTLEVGAENTAIGTLAGANNTAGTGNVYIGHRAGTLNTTSESNKLYINNSANNQPLILGNFDTGLLTVNNTVSASAFSGSFSGDGSGLTGITATADWNGLLDGNAKISGSLIVSGAEAVFTNGVTGSSFTGSFSGDGSQLTGVNSEWDGTRDGNAEITGSLIVSGSNITVDLAGPTTIDSNIKIHNSTLTSLGIGYQTFNSINTGDRNTVVGYQAALTAESGDDTAILGYKAGSNFGSFTSYFGSYAGYLNSGEYNSAFGQRAMGLQVGVGKYNSAFGYKSIYRVVNGDYNSAFGNNTLETLLNGNFNTAIGGRALRISTNDNNSALGYGAGQYLSIGTGNVYIGFNAGPGSVTEQSNQLYVHNGATNTPLIRGDFFTRYLNIYGNLIVSESITATNFVGDGSELTNVVGTWRVWNGYRWYKNENNLNEYPITGEEIQGRGDGRYENGEWIHGEFKRDMPNGQTIDQNLDINIFISYP